jgi:uncharacterized protein (UPF0333 family)
VIDLCGRAASGVVVHPDDWVATASEAAAAVAATREAAWAAEAAAADRMTERFLAAWQQAVDAEARS